MSNSRLYYSSSSSRSSKRENDDRKQESRLPSHVAGTHGLPSPYDFKDVKYSLPSHDKYDRSKQTLYSHPESSSISGGYSAYSSSSQLPTQQYTHPAGITSQYSSRTNSKYPLNDGHCFQAFFNGDKLVPVTPPCAVPQGLVRSCDIPGEDDPRKKYKCKQCGKGFDRPSSLETHSLRHTGDKPYPCPSPGCDKAFSVRSNMSRHYRKLHDGEEENDHMSNRQYPTATSRDSPSEAFYSSSSRRR